jgi:hypothetical protein
MTSSTQFTVERSGRRERFHKKQRNRDAQSG